MMNIKRMLVIILFGFSLQALWSMDNNIGFTYRVDWETYTLHADGLLNFSAAGLSLPGGRAQAEEIVDMEFPRLARPFLLRLPVDSSTDLETHINQGHYSLLALDKTIAEAVKSAPSLTTDLQKLRVSYAINLNSIITSLIRHTNPAPIPRSLVPVAVRPYTGIIIFADSELPVHGRAGLSNTVPCLFPKIWDSEMNLIYERNMVDPQLAGERGIVRYAHAAQVLSDTPSGIDPSLQSLIGNDPMRILARGLFGIRTTDIIIDRQDALSIIGNEQNRQLLKEGRVVIISGTLR